MKIIPAGVFSLVLSVIIHGDVAAGWGDLSAYLDKWPERLAAIKDGPGTVRPRA